MEIKEGELWIHYEIQKQKKINLKFENDLREVLERHGYTEAGAGTDLTTWTRDMQFEKKE